MKIENYKKRQHYVWKHYLKPWTTNGKIWCKKNDSIFNPSLKQIGYEKSFYESHKLNELENALVTGMVNKMHPSGHKSIFSMYNGYLVTANSTDYLKHNGIEDYHSSVEQSVISILNDLYKKDMSFLNENYKKMNICYFLGMQYTRTKKTQISASNSISKLPTPSEFSGKFDPDKLAKVVSLIIFAEVITNWIYSKANFAFLENNTEIAFITGDQPIYNLKTKDLNPGEVPKEFELYYPITPNLAILISDKKTSNKMVNPDEANEFNSFIFKISNEQIYSHKKDLLLKYEQA